MLMAFAAAVPALTYHSTSPEGLSPPFLLARLLESAGATWDPHAGASAIAYGLATLLTGFGAVAILVGKLPVLQVSRQWVPLCPAPKLCVRLAQGPPTVLCTTAVDNCCTQVLFTTSCRLPMPMDLTR